MLPHQRQRPHQRRTIKSQLHLKNICKTVSNVGSVRFWNTQGF
jgi:hypothetical protein